jgi:predicted naringenin-chalcone synthase
MNNYMVKLLSIGTALPSGLLPQEQAFEQARSYNCTSPREEQVLQKLYKRTLIQTRPTIFSPQTKSHRDKLSTRTIDTSTCTLDSFYPQPGTTGDTDNLCHSCLGAAGSSGQPGTAARMARYKQEVTPLAAAAARQALAKIDMPASRIGNLITVSCTGFFAPGLDTEIIQALGLSPGVSRTHVGFMGCHGAMNGLRVGSALAKANHSVSLIVAAELCSLHFQYGTKSDDVLANALFADGAAAALLSDSSEPIVGDSGAAMSKGGGGCNLVASASYLLPDSQTAMTWQIGDHGFFMTLGPEVPDLIRKHLAQWLEQWLGQFDLDIKSVASWAVHPGGPRVLDAVEQALALAPRGLAVSREIFTRLGNMSSPTILFILDSLSSACADKPIVALAFGPGLTIEAALFR